MRILIVEIPEPVSQPGLPVGEAHPVGRLWVKGQPVAVQRHHHQQTSPHHTPPISWTEYSLTLGRQGSGPRTFPSRSRFGSESTYCTIYREPDILAVVWFNSSPIPSTLPSVGSTGDAQEDWERETTCWREREWGRSQIIRRRESLILFK